MIAKPDTRVSRLVVQNWLLGIVFGVLFASALLWLDFAGIGGLIRRSEAAVPALCLLYGGFAVTFGSVVCGTAIMLAGCQTPDDLEE